MTLSAHALLLLNAQRHDLDDRPDERSVARDWAHHVADARAQGWVVAFVQWDAPHGAAWDTFSKDWTLHPDFRAETGDLLIRAVKPDAFSTSGLDGELRARAVQHVRFLGLPDAPETAVMQEQAAAHGYAVNPVQELENA